jgi:hypothetical protein
MLRGDRSLYTLVLKLRGTGTRHSVKIPASLVRQLHAGDYRLTLRAGSSRATLGTPIAQAFRITRSR